MTTAPTKPLATPDQHEPKEKVITREEVISLLQMSDGKYLKGTVEELIELIDSMQPENEGMPQNDKLPHATVQRGTN